MDIELITAAEELETAAYRLEHARVSEFAECFAAISAARKQFRDLRVSRRPTLPAERSPANCADYSEAPEWVTNILEGYPSDGIFVYARFDGECYRGSPSDPSASFSSFAMITDPGAEIGEPGWQVVSERPGR